MVPQKYYRTAEDINFGFGKFPSATLSKFPPNELEVKYLYFPGNRSGAHAAILRENGCHSTLGPDISSTMGDMTMKTNSATTPRSNLSPELIGMVRRSIDISQTMTRQPPPLSPVLGIPFFSWICESFTPIFPVTLDGYAEYGASRAGII